jgi:hypothetical protein
MVSLTLRPFFLWEKVADTCWYGWALYSIWRCGQVADSSVCFADWTTGDRLFIHSIEPVPDPCISWFFKAPSPMVTPFYEFLSLCMSSLFVGNCSLVEYHRISHKICTSLLSDSIKCICLSLYVPIQFIWLRRTRFWQIYLQRNDLAFGTAAAAAASHSRGSQVESTGRLLWLKF